MLSARGLLTDGEEFWTLGMIRWWTQLAKGKDGSSYERELAPIYPEVNGQMHRLYLDEPNDNGEGDINVWCDSEDGVGLRLWRPCRFHDSGTDESSEAVREETPSMEPFPCTSDADRRMFKKDWIMPCALQGLQCQKLKWIPGLYQDCELNISEMKATSVMLISYNGYAINLTTNGTDNPCLYAGGAVDDEDIGKVIYSAGKIKFVDNDWYPGIEEEEDFEDVGRHTPGAVGPHRLESSTGRHRKTIITMLDKDPTDQPRWSRLIKFNLYDYGIIEGVLNWNNNCDFRYLWRAYYNIRDLLVDPGVTQTVVLKTVGGHADGLIVRVRDLCQGVLRQSHPRIDTVERWFMDKDMPTPIRVVRVGTRVDIPCHLAFFEKNLQVSEQHTFGKITWEVVENCAVMPPWP